MRRQIHYLPVTHATLGDDVVGEMLHVGARPLSTVTSMQLSWSK